MMRAIINANIFDYESYRENQYIIFDEEILETGDMEDFHGVPYSYGVVSVIDANGSIVMPGLIVAHTHMYSAFARGMSLPFNPKSFKDILTQLWWKLDSELDKDAVFYSGIACGIDFIKNGVTSIIDHHASGLYIEGSLNELRKAICEFVGIRGIFCFETSDRFDVEQCINENINYAKKPFAHTCGLFGMHALLSLSDETLKRIADSFEKMPIHIHVAESQEDQDNSLNKFGMRVVEKLDKMGLITENSILSHCIHINEKEAEIIAKNKAVIAINPNSNMNNAVGLPDLKMFKKAGIKVIMGNDGLGFNIAKDLQNLMFTMHHHYNSPTAVGLDDIKEIIDNGYEYTGRMLKAKLGRIKEGYDADMIIVEYAPSTPMTEQNALGHIIFGVFDNLRPRDVFCNGSLKCQNYKLIAPLYKLTIKSQDAARKVWERILDKKNPPTDERS